MNATRWLVAALGLGFAGWVHLSIMPVHFAHAAAHGLFFGALGALQLGWMLSALIVAAAMALRDDDGHRGDGHRTDAWRGAALRAVGQTIAGGAIVLWLLTQTVATPFATSPEPIDTATVLSKLAELIAMVALATPATASVRRWRVAAAHGLIALIAGGAMWQGGLVAQQRLPALMPAPGHDHDHEAHAHDETAPTPSLLATVHAAQRLVRTLLVPSAYDWQLPPGFPPPRVPDDNPMTAAKVELGRHLFYDVRLSGNGTQSCASCHLQERAFSDGLARSRGSTGEVHPRNAMALVNVAYSATLTWAHPQLDRLEDQVQIPMFGSHPIELGIAGQEDVVLDRLRAAPRYAPLFAEAFPGVVDPVQWRTVIQALASFTRALISGDSPYDRFVYGGETDALSASAQRGMALFLSEDFECHHCHGGFNFSVATVHQATAFDERVFHNTGLYDLGDGAYPHGNEGLYEVTHIASDRGKFRPPTLRNVAVTAPYMHDGSIDTLSAVLDTYAAGGRHVADGPLAGDGRRNPNKSGFVPGFSMTPQEKADLLAFLHALTDETFLSDPRFADPFAPSPPPARVAALTGDAAR
ncbi:MAG: MbnH family di-heme enzyme [Acidobacteriota bacterium]